MFNKVLKHFKSLPEDRQQFAYGKYYNGKEDCYCAVGSLDRSLFLKHVIKDFNINTKPITDLVRDTTDFTSLMEKFDIDVFELSQLQSINDTFSKIDCTPKERYNFVIRALEELMT